MEGILKKWTNIISRWKQRYVVIQKDKLTYFKKKGEKIQGTYTLKGSKLELVKKKPLHFRIHCLGGEILYFKALNIEDKEKWIKAVKEGLSDGETVKEQEIVEDLPLDKMKALKKKLIDILKNRLLNESSKLSKNMKDIYELQEQLDVSLAELMKVLSANQALPPEASLHMDSIANCSKNLKVSFSIID